MEDSGKTVWVLVLMEDTQVEVAGVFSTLPDALRAVETTDSGLEEWRDAGNDIWVGRTISSDQDTFSWIIEPMPMGKLVRGTFLTDLLEDRGEV